MVRVGGGVVRVEVWLLLGVGIESNNNILNFLTCKVMRSCGVTMMP